MVLSGSQKSPDMVQMSRQYSTFREVQVFGTQVAQDWDIPPKTSKSYKTQFTSPIRSPFPSSSCTKGGKFYPQAETIPKRMARFY